MQTFTNPTHNRRLPGILPKILLLALLLTATGSLLAQSPDTETATANTSSGPGVAWSGTGNTIASDDTRATVTLNDEDSEFLVLSDFGFSIPAGSTIDGIEVSIERSIDNTGGSRAVQDVVVQLLDAAGSATGNNKAATSTNWPGPSAEASATYGNNTDLWGATWSVSDINDTNFGIQIQVTGQTPGGSTVTARIDQVQITVHYTAGGGCSLSGLAAANVNCNDNGTANDPTDDYVTFELNFTGQGPGTYAVTANDGSGAVAVTLTNPSGGAATGQSYAANPTFSLPVGTADNGVSGGGRTYTITVTDESDGTCNDTATINPVNECSDCPTSPYSGGIQTPVINNN